MILDADSQSDLERRQEVGREAISLADDNDDETNASDVISDILTALYGPAGHYVGSESGGWRLVQDGDAQANAQDLLDRALRSYEGDAEDYTVDSDA